MVGEEFIRALAPHYDSAARYCRSLVGSGPAAQADDLLQDALLKALNSFHRLHDPEKFKPWLFAIITRNFVSSGRGFWRHCVPFDDAQAMPPVFDDDELMDEQRLVLQALNNLTKKERTALLLFEVCGFSIEEVKQIQGDRSLSAVKSRLSRARARAREAIRSAIALDHLKEIQNYETLEDESIRISEQAREALGG